MNPGLLAGVTKISIQTITRSLAHSPSPSLPVKYRAPHLELHIVAVYIFVAGVYHAVNALAVAYARFHPLCQRIFCFAHKAYVKCRCHLYVAPVYFRCGWPAVYQHLLEVSAHAYRHTFHYLIAYTRCHLCIVGTIGYVLCFYHPCWWWRRHGYLAATYGISRVRCCLGSCSTYAACCTLR